jgi:hypothetical protein
MGMTAANRRTWVNGMTLVGLGIAAVGALAHGQPFWMVVPGALAGMLAQVAGRVRTKSNVAAYVIGSFFFLMGMVLTYPEPGSRAIQPFLLAGWLGMFWFYDWSAEHWPD